jgi:hypothetical protein
MGRLDPPVPLDEWLERWPRLEATGMVGGFRVVIGGEEWT